MANPIIYVGLLLAYTIGNSQGDDPPVCSAVGGLCSTTNGCCGQTCCENNVCVSQSFSCSGDLAPVPGFDVCTDHYCRPGEVCYLGELRCDDEFGRNCQKMPSCRAGSPTRSPGRIIVEHNSAELRSHLYYPLVTLIVLGRVI